MTTSIRKLLDMLGEQLENGYDVLAQKRPPYEEHDLDFGNVSDDSDSDDSSEQVPELVQRLQTIVTTIRSLYKLSFAIRRLGARVVSQKAELYRDLIPGSEVEYGEGFHLLDREHVVNLLNDLRRVALTSSEDRDVNDQRSRHPDASEEPLTDRLTSAITKRRRQFRYWKSHKQKLAQVATVEIKGFKQDSMPQEQERTTGTVIEKSKPDATASARSRDPRTETEATRYVPAPSGQEDAVSIAPSASTARDLDGHEAMLPAPPETYGQDWECPLCFVLCPEKEAIGSRWRKHVLEDLQPYLCTYLECPLPDQLYGSRSAWLSHEETYHRRIWRCREHQDLIFTAAERYHAHVSSFHPNIEPEHVQTLIDSSVAVRLDTREQCPLCLIPVSMLRHGQNLPKHMANHLERIACFAIPRNLYAEGDIDDDSSLKPNSHQTETSQTLSDTTSNVTSRASTPSPLCTAALNGSLDLVRSLLRDGADVNFEDKNKESDCVNALQAASESGNAELVNLLLNFGADVNAQGGFYGNALQVASFQGFSEIVTILLEHGADVNAEGGIYGNALQAAAYGGEEKTMKLLLDAGADVHMAGGHYGNALQAAASDGAVSIVRLLIKHHGADVNTQAGYYGNTLQAASATGDEATSRLLLEHGALPNAQGGQYGNALAAASVFGHETIVQILLDNGADASNAGALTAAAKHGHEAIVQLLLDRGVNEAELTDALRAAAEKRHDAIVRLLLGAGADSAVLDPHYVRDLI